MNEIYIIFTIIQSILSCFFVIFRLVLLIGRRSEKINRLRRKYLHKMNIVDWSRIGVYVIFIAIMEIISRYKFTLESFNSVGTWFYFISGFDALLLIDNEE